MSSPLESSPGSSLKVIDFGLARNWLIAIALPNESPENFVRLITMFDWMPRSVQNHLVNLLDWTSGSFSLTERNREVVACILNQGSK